MGGSSSSSSTGGNGRGGGGGYVPNGNTLGLELVASKGLLAKCEERRTTTTMTATTTTATMTATTTNDGGRRTVAAASSSSSSSSSSSGGVGGLAGRIGVLPNKFRSMRRIGASSSSSSAAARQQQQHHRRAFESTIASPSYASTMAGFGSPSDPPPVVRRPLPASPPHPPSHAGMRRIGASARDTPAQKIRRRRATTNATTTTTTATAAGPRGAKAADDDDGRRAGAAATAPGAARDHRGGASSSSSSSRGGSGTTTTVGMEDAAGADRHLREEEEEEEEEDVWKTKSGPEDSGRRSVSSPVAVVVTVINGGGGKRAGKIVATAASRPDGGDGKGGGKRRTAGTRPDGGAPHAAARSGAWADAAAAVVGADGRAGGVPAGTAFGDDDAPSSSAPPPPPPRSTLLPDDDGIGRPPPPPGPPSAASSDDRPRTTDHPDQRDRSKKKKRPTPPELPSPSLVRDRHRAEKVLGVRSSLLILNEEEEGKEEKPPSQQLQVRHRLHKRSDSVESASSWNSLVSTSGGGMTAHPPTDNPPTINSSIRDYFCNSTISFSEIHHALPCSDGAKAGGAKGIGIDPGPPSSSSSSSRAVDGSPRANDERANIRTEGPIDVTPPHGHGQNKIDNSVEGGELPRGSPTSVAVEFLPASSSDGEYSGKEGPKELTWSQYLDVRKAASAATKAAWRPPSPDVPGATAARRPHTPEWCLAGGGWSAHDDATLNSIDTEKTTNTRTLLRTTTSSDRKADGDGECVAASEGGGDREEERDDPVKSLNDVCAQIFDDVTKILMGVFSNDYDGGIADYPHVDDLRGEEEEQLLRMQSVEEQEAEEEEGRALEGTDAGLIQEEDDDVGEDFDGVEDQLERELFNASWFGSTVNIEEDVAANEEDARQIIQEDRVVRTTSIDPDYEVDETEEDVVDNKERDALTSGRERSEAAGVELELCGFDKRSRNLDIKTRSHSWNSDASGPVEEGTEKQLPHSLGDDDGQSGRGSTTSYSSFSSQARAFLQTVAGTRLPPNSVECMPPPEIQRNLQPINLFHDRNKNEDGNTFQDGQYEVGRDDLTQSGNIHTEGNKKLQHKDDDVCSEDSTKSGNDYGDECSTVSDNPSLKSNETGSTKEADAASLHSDDAGSLYTYETTHVSQAGCNPSWFDRGFKNCIDAIDEGCTFVPQNEECGDDDSTKSPTLVEEDLREHYKEYQSSSRRRNSREPMHHRSTRYYRHLERTRRSRKSRGHERSLSSCPIDGTDSHCLTEGTEETDCPTAVTDYDDVSSVESRSTVDTGSTIETKGTFESRSTVDTRSIPESRSYPPDTDTRFNDKNQLAANLWSSAHSLTEQADTKKKAVAGRGGGSSKRIAMISSLKHNPFRLKRGQNAASIVKN